MSESGKITKSIDRLTTRKHELVTLQRIVSNLEEKDTDVIVTNPESSNTLSVIVKADEVYDDLVYLSKHMTIGDTDIVYKPDEDKYRVEKTVKVML